MTSTARLSQLKFGKKPVALRCRLQPENH
jgi:hypothetical protein